MNEFTNTLASLTSPDRWDRLRSHYSTVIPPSSIAAGGINPTVSTLSLATTPSGMLRHMSPTRTHCIKPVDMSPPVGKPTVMNRSRKIHPATLAGYLYEATRRSTLRVFYLTWRLNVTSVHASRKLIDIEDKLSSSDARAARQSELLTSTEQAAKENSELQTRLAAAAAREIKLEQEVDGLQQKIAVSKQAQEQASTDISGFKQQIAEVRDSLLQAEHSAEVLTTENATLKAEGGDLSQINETLVQKVSSIEAEKALADELLDHAKEENDELTTQCTAYSQQLEAAQATIQDLKTQQDVQSQLRVKENEESLQSMQNFTESEKLLKDQVQHLRALLDRANSEAEEQAALVTSLNATVTSLTKQKAETEAQQVADLTVANIDLQSKLGEASGRIAFYESEQKAYKEHQEALQQRVVALGSSQTMLEEKTAEAGRLRDEGISLQKQLDASVAKTNDLEAKLADSASEAARKLEEIHEKTVKLEQSLLTKANEVASLQTAAGDKDAQLADLHQQKDGALADLNTMKQQADEDAALMRQEVDALRQKIASREEGGAELQQQLDESRAEATAKSEEVQRLLEEGCEADGALEGANTLVAKFQQQLSEREQAQKSLEARLEEATSENLRLTEQLQYLADKEAEIDRLNHAVNGSGATLTEQQARIAELEEILRQCEEDKQVTAAALSGEADEKTNLNELISAKLAEIDALRLAVSAREAVIAEGDAQKLTAIEGLKMELIESRVMIDTIKTIGAEKEIFGELTMSELSDRLVVLEEEQEARVAALQGLHAALCSRPSSIAAASLRATLMPSTPAPVPVAIPPVPIPPMPIPHTPYTTSAPTIISPKRQGMMSPRMPGSTRGSSILTHAPSHTHATMALAVPVSVPPLPAVPVDVALSAPTVPSASGRYVLAGTECPLRGLPVWACGDKRIFAGAGGRWLVGAHPGSIEKNRGCVRSAAPHGNRLPHTISHWETADGKGGWIPATVHLEPSATGAWEDACLWAPATLEL